MQDYTSSSSSPSCAASSCCPSSSACCSKTVSIMKTTSPPTLKAKLQEYSDELPNMLANLKDMLDAMLIFFVSTLLAVILVVLTADRQVANGNTKSDDAILSIIDNGSSSSSNANNKINNNSTHDEPSFLAKQLRRISVYRMAIQTFIEYQFAKREASRIQQSLNLTDAQAEEHPDIVHFWSLANRKTAQRLTDQIKTLEGFWIKVGQYLSSRADVMPLEFVQELSALQDDLPERSFDNDIMATLHEELTPVQFKSIESIDPVSLSTASLAQVHRAKLTNGQEVAIKVQHRGVASLMRQDVENLHIIMEFLARFEPDLDFESVVKEYSMEVEKELDFRAEAVNMNEVRLLMAENKVDVIVPRAIPGLVTERVLVMEFCDGFSVRNIKAMKKHNVDRKLLLERICTAWAVQMHVGGVFNTDPHAGNILVSTAPGKDGSVPVLLDFGLTKRFDHKMKLGLSRLMHATDVGDADELTRSFDEMGVKMNRHDPFEDLVTLQQTFHTTIPQSKAKKVQKRLSHEYQARVAAMKKEQGLGEHDSLRNPIDAWPAELIFFARVSNLLRGLCSYLDVKYPYLNTMAKAARTTICESVPTQDRAKSLVHDRSSVSSDALREKLEGAIADVQKEGSMVGLQLNVRVGGEERVNVAAGVLGTANPRPVTPSTLFNVFSVGKAYLAIGVLRLVQDGKIDLDEPVATYWPEFGKKDITVRYVLSHQSGMPNAMPRDGSLDEMLDWDSMKKFMESTGTQYPCGQQTKYHYLSLAWLCGGLIEAVTKQPYDQYLKSVLADPDSDEEFNLHAGGLPEDIDNDELAVLSVHHADLAQLNNAAAEAAKREKMKQMKLKQEAERKKAMEAATAPIKPAAAASSPTKAVAAPSAAASTPTKPSINHKKILAKYAGRKQLMTPTMYNMRKVRSAKLPSANMHASASSLAKVMDDIIMKERSLTNETIAMAQQQQGDAQTAVHALLNDSSAFFGLGLVVHEFEYEGRKVQSFGHPGLGGSLVICIPDVKLTVALTINQLSYNSMVRKRVLKIVFDEFELKPPASVLR